MKRPLAVAMLVAAVAIGAWSVASLTAALSPDRAGSMDALRQPAPAGETAAPISEQAGRVMGPDGRVSDLPSRPPARAAATTDSIRTRPARLAEHSAPAIPAPAPSRVLIPALEIDAPIDDIGVDSDGSLTVPDDVGRVGWYRHGAVPGSATGSVVLTGHVDSRQQGPGAFFDLATIEPGAVVEVELTDGNRVRYEVTGRERLEKSLLPLDEVFRRDGPHVLTLVTCGGPFDGARRSYRDNVVVVATKVA